MTLYDTYFTYLPTFFPNSTDSRIKMSRSHSIIPMFTELVVSTQNHLVAAVDRFFLMCLYIIQTWTILQVCD